MDVVHRNSPGGIRGEVLPPDPDAVNDSHPFGRETESVQAFLRAVSAAPQPVARVARGKNARPLYGAGVLSYAARR